MPMGLPSWPHGSDSSELVGCRSRYISSLLAARGSYLCGCTKLGSRHRRKIGCVPTPWSRTRPAWVRLESLSFGRCTQRHSDSLLALNSRSLPITVQSVSRLARSPLDCRDPAFKFSHQWLSQP